MKGISKKKGSLRLEDGRGVCRCFRAVEAWHLIRFNGFCGADVRFRVLGVHSRFTGCFLIAFDVSGETNANESHTWSALKVHNTLCRNMDAKENPFVSLLHLVFEQTQWV
jgi:hypothetical protein